MSKKKVSTKTTTSVKMKKLNDDLVWQEPLESISINDDHWWCLVTMMIETKTDHARFVSMFNEAAEEGKRKAIYTLNRQKMLANVWSLSRQDPDKCPVLQRVCHHANKLLEANIESTWLLARVIKYMIYRAKVEAVVRAKKEQELKSAIEDEYRIMQTVLDPGTSRSIFGKKKDDKGYSLRGKANTRLRIREEEWRDTVYVDDAPLYGPNLYVVLTGFQDPDLPVELINIGVPLTCILKIKRSGEKLEPVSLDYRTEEEHRDTVYDRMKLRYPETYTVNKIDLYKFWISLKNIYQDSRSLGVFSNVAFLTFKPTILSETSDDLEYETLKKDIYDKISFIVYDLYDLLRKHSNYIRSMLIHRYDIDEMKEEADTKVYCAILDALPTVCVTVPTLLHALLLQIEANLDIRIDRSSDERNVTAKEYIYERKEEKEENKVSVESIDGKEEIEKENSWIRKRLKLFNQMYKLDKSKNIVEEKFNESTIELILHGDKLSLNTRHITLNDDVKRMLKLSNDTTLADTILQVYRDPRIIDGWSGRDKLTDNKAREYDCYINKIINYFDPGIEISRENVNHYLHFLIFDKMIHGNSSKIIDDEFRVRSSSLDNPCKILKDSISFSFVKKNKKKKSKFLSKSDTDVDYGKPVAAFLSCPSLFGLTDTRELLLPSYLEKNVFEERRRGRMHRPKKPLLEEYNDVELLPKKVLLQTIYECFQNYEYYEKRYFEPTDSILLYFSNDYKIGQVSESTIVSNLRTPVCLRDFVKYVQKEEIDWINREEEKYRLESIEKMNDSPINEITFSKEDKQFHLRFNDEHFVLPNSLKARYWNTKLLTVTEEKYRTRLDEFGKKVKDEEKIVNGKEKEDKRKKEKKKDTKTWSEKISSKERKEETNGIDTSFLPRRKILSLESAKEDEPHEFVGHDLGNLRVQIVEKRKIFNSEDGTLVRVNLERWLYENLDLRIAVTLYGCTLRLFEKIPLNPTSFNVFHLTTDEGIVLAFSKQIGAASNSGYRKKLEFDFHASWPSGLTISPVTGDSPDNPFYIRQSYVSKGPDDVSREAYRKYLRNGTVLKFLHDNSVIVLCSNGVVVECISFEDNITEEKHFEDDRGIKDRKEENGINSKRKKRVPSIKTRVFGSLEEENEDVQRASTTMTDELMTDGIRTEMQYAGIKVTGYNVLDHDGRRYEVLRDLIVREYDRLLVRANSDYEVDENFTRRSDGTDMLFRSNGELIVQFTDGTRITTGYKIEKRPLICDWTTDEFERYFGSIKLYEHDDRLFKVNSRSNNGNKDEDGMGVVYDDNQDEDRNSNDKELLWHQDGDPLNGEEGRYQDEMMRILIADGFVSVLLTSLLEHKNYAGVSYDQSAVSCTLSMPPDLRVSISRRGHYEVSAPGKVNLKIESDKLIFSAEMCATCAGRSTSVYNFNGRRSEPIVSTIFTSTDLFGNVFEVKSDGTTSYRGKSRERPSRKFDFNENVPDDVGTSKRVYQEYQGEEDEEEEKEYEEKMEEGRYEILEKVGPRKHYNLRNDHDEKYCQEHKSYPQHDPKLYRILSINRDLNGYEYVHRSVRHREEMIIHLNKEASAIFHPVSIHRSSLHHLITFAPLETELRSKALLQLDQIPKVKPTNADRRDLVRSTYSIPYDWLFPFGRNGHGICSDTYDMPLAKTTEIRPPRTLRLRILLAFKEPDRNAIIDLQRAMALYWRYLVDNFDECQGSFDDGFHSKLEEEEEEEEEEDEGEEEDDYKTWKDNIIEFALGIRTNIDVTTYLHSLEKCRRKVSLRKTIRNESKRLPELLESRKANDIRLQWHKRCIRENIILPYFENIVGTCFLLTIDFLELAFLMIDKKEIEEVEVEMENRSERKERSDIF